jgi:hypothetical protein
VIQSRLWWDAHAGRGFAQHDGVEVALRRAPELGGFERVTSLDYSPRGWAQIRLGCDREREMTETERRQCSAILRNVAAMARGVLSQPLGPDLAEEL